MTNKDGWFLKSIDTFQSICLGLGSSTLFVILVTLYIPSVQKIFETDMVSFRAFQMGLCKIDAVLLVLSGQKIWKIAAAVLISKAKEVAEKSGIDLEKLSDNLDDKKE